MKRIILMLFLFFSFSYSNSVIYHPSDYSKQHILTPLPISSLPPMIPIGPHSGKRYVLKEDSYLKLYFSCSLNDHYRGREFYELTYPENVSMSLLRVSKGSPVVPNSYYSYSHESIDRIAYVGTFYKTQNNSDFYHVKDFTCDSEIARCSSDSFLDFNTMECKTCPEGQVWDSEKNQCVEPCSGGRVKNSDTGQCECPPYKDNEYEYYMTYYNKERDLCMACAPGTYLNPNTGQCDVKCNLNLNNKQLADCLCQQTKNGNSSNSKAKMPWYSGLFSAVLTTVAGRDCGIPCENGSALALFEYKDVVLYKRFCEANDPSDGNSTDGGGNSGGGSTGNPGGDNPGGNINPDDGTFVEVDLTTIEDNEKVIDDVLERELDKVKKEIEVMKEVEIIEKPTPDTKVVKVNKDKVNPKDYAKKDEAGKTTGKITNPKPGVTVIEEKDGSTTIVFDGREMKPSNGKNGKDGKDGRDAISKDYTGKFNRIIELLGKIEKNTKGIGDGTSKDGNGTGLGEGNKTGEGNGTGDGSGKGGFKDGWGGLDDGGLYDENMAGIEKVNGIFDKAGSKIGEILDFFKGKGMPSLNKSTMPNTCPITRNFAAGQINKAITWDLCKVFSPVRAPIYVFSYILFLGIGVALSFKILFVLFIGV